jgi:dTDP-4-amino-4,6-dideoxygalactose transaminase
MAAIPFNDLKAQYRSIKAEIDAAIGGVLENACFVLGPAVEAFEQDFAQYCGTRHAVALNSGASALHLALLTAGIGAGDEVITTPMTFIATAAAIRYVGATPVFVDVDPKTWNIDPKNIASAVTAKTKAILPVHLHGLMADMDPIMAIASENDLIVIEDAAQAHGAEYKGRRAGSVGAFGCYSFYPGKNLGAYGEGGCVVTDDDDFASTLRIYRDCGQKAKYTHVLNGFNYRMDGIQGAVLGVKLKYLEEWTELRRQHAGLYSSLLSGGNLDRPVEPAEYRHVYHVYAVALDERDAVQAEMSRRGVATGIHYPVCVHQQPSFSDLNKGDVNFPIAEALGRRFLSLPIFPEMREDQVQGAADALVDAISG